MSIAQLKTEFGLKYDSSDIGRNIVKFRKQKKITRHRLAYKACVDGTVLMRIERGENSPTLDTLLKIIDGLDISLAKFFRGFTEH
ncbi:transcriptional regulator XRE family [Candidatus Termititenax aidoneus]|uniref:Transcriptional regulator XRE family n=1 Tax=Termititenax aidoneus TaxID=2218524 RepID=A0A388TBQ1_TERA1|nr:transcriptional regulator XRE family [Candidatus Termititenax aidoneus]